tara:strand:+ start:605 stop:1405 length:801 start_codon:yes stop_codon:yes gene_type:complete
MKNRLKIFCVTDKQLPNLESGHLILAGVGKKKFNNKYLESSTNENISYKEKYYSELTFHYWYWKNLLKEEKSEWIGFCQKRRFWIKSSSVEEKINSQNMNNHLLSEPESDWNKYESILCNSINISGAKKIKIFKRGWKNLIFNPKLIFKKDFETIKIQFDMHHGYQNLEKAINVLNTKDKNDFLYFVNNNNSYNPHIMFITKPEIANNWFKALFEWLSRCEEIFGFERLKGYDTTRLYAYLAERYLSFWFNKYTKTKNSPWVFIDH